MEPADRRVVVVDLHDRLVRRHSGVVGERGAHDDEQIRLVHQPTGHGRTAAAEDSGPERVRVGYQTLGLERREHGRAQLLRQGAHLCSRQAGPVAHDDDRAPRGPHQIAGCRKGMRLRRYHPIGETAGGPRGLGGARLGLHLVRENEVRDAAGVAGVLDRERREFGMVGSTVDGRGPGGDVAEDGREVHVLERAATEHLRRHLTRYRDDGCLVELGVVQAGEQVRRTRSGDGETRGGTAGQLAVRARGERRRALVADPDIRQLAALLGPAHRLGEPEIRVPDHAEHVRDAVRHQRLHEHVGDGAHGLGAGRQPHEDAVVALLDVVGHHAVGEPGGRPAGQRVVVVAVPRAAQPPVLDRTLPQRAALVRAAVVERAELDAAAGQGDGPAADHHAAHPPVAGHVNRVNPVPLFHAGQSPQPPPALHASLDHGCRPGGRPTGSPA